MRTVDDDDAAGMTALESFSMAWSKSVAARCACGVVACRSTKEAAAILLEYDVDVGAALKTLRAPRPRCTVLVVVALPRPRPTLAKRAAAKLLRITAKWLLIGCRGAVST